jgi:hypothetical protein
LTPLKNNNGGGEKVMAIHYDTRVEDALVKLRDALCSWERATGSESVLILRERDFVTRAVNGKPVDAPDITDEELFKILK